MRSLATILLLCLAACGQGPASTAAPARVDGPARMPARGTGQAQKAAPNLTYRGGILLDQPRYTAIYWGSYWTTTKGRDDVSFYDAFLNTMAGSARFMSVTREYSRPEQPIGPGSYHGGITVPTDPAVALNDTAIRDLIEAQLVAGTVPKADPSQVYVVLLPPCVDVQAGPDKSCDQMCGYHWDLWSTTAPQRVPYVVIPHPDCWGCRFAALHDLSVDELNRDSATVILSHEMIETVTDPVVGTGWYDDANGEISDICGGQGGFFDQGQLLGFRVQKHWSNEEKACVLEREIPVGSAGCPAETHQVGSVCAPDLPASCASARGSSAWSLLAAGLALVLRRRASKR